MNAQVEAAEADGGGAGHGERDEYEREGQMEGV